MCSTLPRALLALAFVAVVPQTATAAAQTVVMDALEAELARATKQLKLQDYDAPYHVAYTVKDVERRSLWGKVGAVHEDRARRTRQAYVDVRVGDYALDSSEDLEPDWPLEDSYEPTVALPLEASKEAIQHTLWLLSDVRYKQAIASYLKVRGQRVFQAGKKEERPSFSRAPVVRHRDAPVPCQFDRERWIRLVETASAVLASDPLVFDGAVHVEARCQRRWYADGPGTRLTTNQTIYALHLTAWARAPDGMLLERTWDRFAPTEAGIPAQREVLQAARDVVADLKALAVAPELGPYTGPALLEPPATGVFFHEVLGHRLEGHRQDDEEEGQTFADYLDKKIMPTWLSVSDDPTRRQHQGMPLNGHYRYDDEGVRAQHVSLVDRGILKGFLMGRRPVAGFSASNGHGRAEGLLDPVARMGNLVVEAHETVSRQALKKKLLEEARKQGRPYGLIVRDVTGGATNTSSYGFQAFKGQAHMVYRVDAQTGEETLVRGVDIVGTPLTSLNNILAASDETGVFNGYCGAESGMIPVSTVAPAVLFREIELQRAAQGRSRGPVLPAP